MVFVPNKTRSKKKQAGEERHRECNREREKKKDAKEIEFTNVQRIEAEAAAALNTKRIQLNRRI